MNPGLKWAHVVMGVAACLLFGLWLLNRATEDPPEQPALTDYRAYAATSRDAVFARVEERLGSEAPVETIREYHASVEEVFRLAFAGKVPAAEVEAALLNLLHEVEPGGNPISPNLLSRSMMDALSGFADDPDLSLAAITFAHREADPPNTVELEERDGVLQIRRAFTAESVQADRLPVSSP